MAVDALEYDESAEDANPAGALEEILENPERLKDLDLDAFAEELERQVGGVPPPPPPPPPPPTHTLNSSSTHYGWRVWSRPLRRRTGVMKSYTAWDWCDEELHCMGLV